MQRLLCVFLISVSLLADTWTVNALPSNALVIRTLRQARANPAIFGDLSTNDTSVSIILEPSAPWEDFIVPGPTVIALLGQLMVLSGKIDFSLQENAPRDGFKYMRHPESFRASLVQVSNDGWGAFMNAHKNMDKIQLYMQQVPAQVKTAIKILSQASPKLVERLLPITLNKIQEIGRTCVELSAETESKFADVMLLLGELLAVTESSRGTHEQQLAQVEVELNVTASQKVIMEQIGEQLKKRQQETDAAVSKYRAAYDDALKKIPTGWKVLVQDLFRAAINVVNFVPQMIGMGGLGGGKGGGGGNIPSFGGGSSPDFEKSKIFAVVGNVFNQVGKLKNAVTNIFKGKDVKDNPTSLFSTFDNVFGYFEDGLKGASPNEFSTKARGFIDSGKAIAKGLENMFSQYPAKPINESEQDQAMQSLDKLAQDMQPMVAEGHQMTGGLATGQEPPSGQGGVSGDIFSGNYGNERYKAYLSLAALRDAESRSDQIFGQVMKFHEEMKELVGKMAMLNLKEINFKEILELLRQGIQILAKIRQQWGKLVQFFSLVAVRAEVALNQTLVPFVEYAKQAEQMIGEGGLDQKDREFFLNLLQEQAQDINKVAYFLYTLSSTYFDVSTRFLMDRLAGLSQMLATDNEDQRQKLLIDLRNQANEAQDAIKVMSQQRREEYTRLVDARKRELDSVVKSLGGPTASEVKAVESVYGKA
jgi:hypothetical protein